MEQLHDQSVDLFLSFDEETGFYRRHVFLYEILKHMDHAQSLAGVFHVYDIGFENLEHREDALGLRVGLLASLAKKLGLLETQGWMLCRYAQHRLVLCSPVQACELEQDFHCQHLLGLIGSARDTVGLDNSFALKVGRARFPQDATQSQVLIENAHLASLWAKPTDKAPTQGCVVLEYDAKLGHLANREAELLEQLSHAVAAREMDLSILPELNLQTGYLSGLNISPIWKHPVHGQIVTEELYRLARSCGQAGTLGETFFELSLAYYASLRKSMGVECNVAIVLPCDLIRLPDVDARLLALTKKAGLVPGDIELCFQESTLLTHDTGIQKVLTAFHRKGFKLTLEGFGQGSASLTALRSLPVYKLSIARNIVENVVSQLDDFYLVSAIVSMAQSLKIKVVADAVTTRAQAAALSRMNCHFGRGDLFACALSTAGFAQWFAIDLPQLCARRAHGATAKQPALLLVDDEPNILAALRRVLKQDGYQIHCANSAQEAFEILAETQIDVIVSDQRMPEMSGTEFLSKVKARYPGTVRLVLSGYTDLQSVTDAINRGAIYKFLTKPWDDEQLRANLREAFQRHDIEQQNSRLKHEVETVNAELVQLNQVLELKISERNERLDRNNDFRQMMQEMLDSLPLAMLGINRTGKVVAVNRVARSLFMENGDLIGQDLNALPAAVAQTIDRFMRAHATKNETDFVPCQFVFHDTAYAMRLKAMEQVADSKACLLMFEPVGGVR